MDKKKGGKILPLILVAVDVILAVIILNARFGTKTPGEVVPDTVPTTEQHAYFTVPEDPTEPATEPATEPVTEVISDPTVSLTGTAAVSESAEAPTEAPVTEKIRYSTDARPTTNDFLGWYTSDVMWNGVPAGVTRLTELTDILGGWKGLIYYDPENTEGSEAIELLNFLVDEGQYGLTLTADWYSIFWMNDGQGENEEDMEDFVFPATWSGGQLKGDRDHVITFTDLYEKDGKQYACGTMETASGIPAKVAMVRP